MSARRPPGFMNAICAEPDSGSRWPTAGPRRPGCPASTRHHGSPSCRRPAWPGRTDHRSGRAAAHRAPAAFATAPSTIVAVSGSGRVVGRTAGDRPSAAARSGTCAGDLTRRGVDGEDQLVQGRAVLTGRDHRTLGHRRDRPSPAPGTSSCTPGGCDRTTIASTLSLTPLMIEPKSDVGSSAIVAQSVLGAPSWTSSTITSAPAALRSSAEALTSVDDVGHVELRDPRRATPARAGAR